MSKKILITEDDADIRFIMHLVLNQAGYQVEELPIGDVLLKGERRDWPDLFILDKVLPGVDGVKLCKFLKANEETKDIPVIIMSSYHGARRKSEDIGADGFLAKPFDIVRLLELVQKNINSHQRG